jgi:hypothetical protein
MILYPKNIIDPIIRAVDAGIINGKKIVMTVRRDGKPFKNGGKILFLENLLEKYIII